MISKKELNLEFKVVENKLTKADGDNSFSCLIVENDYFLIRIYYMDDYAKAIKEGKFDLRFLTVNIKDNKKFIPEFSYAAGNFMMSANPLFLAGLYSVENTDEIIEKFRLGKQNYFEFVKIFEEYFPGCVNKVEKK